MDKIANSYVKNQCQNKSKKEIQEIVDNMEEKLKNKLNICKVNADIEYQINLMNQ